MSCFKGISGEWWSQGGLSTVTEFLIFHFHFILRVGVTEFLIFNFHFILRDGVTEFLIFNFHFFLRVGVELKPPRPRDHPSPPSPIKCFKISIVSPPPIQSALDSIDMSLARVVRDDLNKCSGEPVRKPWVYQWSGGELAKWIDGAVVSWPGGAVVSWPGG